MIVDKLSTGVPGLDELLHGGLPRGRTTLVTGRSGTGKTILALQVAARFAQAGERVLFLTVEETPQDLVTTGDSLGLDVSRLKTEGRIQFLDLTRADDGTVTVAGAFDISALVHRIEALVAARGYTTVVLDSSAALFAQHRSRELVRTQFFQLIRSFRALGLTGIVATEARNDYGDTTSLGEEDYIADVVLFLRNVVDGERRRRTIEVYKYRRSPHFKGEFPFTIAAQGVTVFPLDAGDAGRYGATTDRFASGVTGLDELTCGGWLRDSIVLLRGPTGSGKTLMSGMYTCAGASRGERVIYWGFEETRPMLRRNFAAIGCDVEEYEKQGLVRLLCRYPEATSPDDLLIDLRAGLSEFRPSLIVVDSISSIEHSISPATFRTFMIGLASLLREHGQSALLTQTIAAQSEADQAAPYLSTVCDALLMLDYTVNERRFERTLRVLKMRGSEHVTERAQLRITPRGVQVSGREDTTSWHPVADAIARAKRALGLRA